MSDTELAALRAEFAAAKKALLVPGEMYCAKCSLLLVRTNLYVENVTAGPGDNITEPCPNGCGPLWPETWERSARVLGQRLAEAFDARVKAEAALSRATELLESCRGQSGSLIEQNKRLRAERDALARAAIELERAAKRFMEAINEQFDAENPDEARDAGREPRPLDDVMEARSSAWISLERGIHYSAKARAALEATK